eukprot:3067475-Pleurochrysis_carterae.AAC.6
MSSAKAICSDSAAVRCCRSRSAESARATLRPSTSALSSAAAALCSFAGRTSSTTPAARPTSEIISSSCFEGHGMAAKRLSDENNWKRGATEERERRRAAPRMCISIRPGRVEGNSDQGARGMKAALASDLCAQLVAPLLLPLERLAKPALLVEVKRERQERATAATHAARDRTGQAAVDAT